MKPFSYYVIQGAVKRQPPDRNLAIATARESSDRITFAKSILDTQKPKYALENAYESVREMADAILFLEGYKSYSHEASLAYLKILGVSESLVESVNNTKQRRNDIKYAGGDASKEEAVNAIKIAEEIIAVLEKKLKVRLEI